MAFSAASDSTIPVSNRFMFDFSSSSQLDDVGNRTTTDSNSAHTNTNSNNNGNDNGATRLMSTEFWDLESASQPEFLPWLNTPLFTPNDNSTLPDGSLLSESADNQAGLPGSTLDRWIFPNSWSEGSNNADSQSDLPSSQTLADAIRPTGASNAVWSSMQSGAAREQFLLPPPSNTSWSGHNPSHPRSSTNRIMLPSLSSQPYSNGDSSAHRSQTSLQQHQHHQQQNTCPVASLLPLNPAAATGNSTVQKLQQLAIHLRQPSLFSKACAELVFLFAAPQIYDPAVEPYLFDCLRIVRTRSVQSGFNVNHGFEVFRAIQPSLSLLNPLRQVHIRKWAQDLAVITNHPARNGATCNRSYVAQTSRSQQAQAPTPAVTGRGRGRRPHASRTNSMDSTGSIVGVPSANGAVVVDLQGPAVPSDKDPNFFYRRLACFVNPFQLQHVQNRPEQAEITFNLPKELYSNIRHKSTQFESALVAQLSCYASSDPMQKCAWPEDISIIFNGHVVRIEKKRPVRVQGRAGVAYVGVDRAASITRHCVLGKNTLHIICKLCSCKYCFCVELLIPESKETIVHRTLSNPIAAETVLQQIQNVLTAQSDEEVQVLDDTAKVSMRCPISFVRIETPVRGASCAHLQCFDLNAYLSINKSKSTWLCPVCNKSVPQDGVHLDLFFSRLLQEIPISTDLVEIDTDGQWKLAEEPPRDHSSGSSWRCGKAKAARPDTPPAKTAIAAATTIVPLSAVPIARIKSEPLASPRDPIFVHLCSDCSDEEEDDDSTNRSHQKSPSHTEKAFSALSMSSPQTSQALPQSIIHACLQPSENDSPLITLNQQLPWDDDVLFSSNSLASATDFSGADDNIFMM